MLTIRIRLLKWNIPRGFLHMQHFDRANSPSSLGAQISVPKDFHIHTPPELVDPLHEVSLPVQLSSALASIGVMDRASMFLQGRHNELLKSMNKTEARLVVKKVQFLDTVRPNTYFASTMSIWLYEFWLFGFTTAKNWGRGPQIWNATNLRFSDWQSSSIDSAARSPGSLEPGAQDQSTNSPESHDIGSTDVADPCQFCRWSVHMEYCTASDYHYVSESSSESEFDGGEESRKAPAFEERLKESLESNDFSSINLSQVPVSVPAIVKAVKSSPNELLEEAIGFSIMGRNASLLYDLLRKAREENLVTLNLYPFHLATSYLDGSKTCCLMLAILFIHSPGQWRWDNKANSNDLGHTLLDTLMITILTNHTSTSPGTVDHALKRNHIFPGQETDICGRWDADSPCYQQLLLSGKSAIPSKWKHKFCHTSAQAVCHCITEIDNLGIKLGAPSGLFLNHCSYCGAKLQLSSLHSLVMTSFYLAIAAHEDEDLFGAISCLLKLLTCEIDPGQTSNISLPMLLGVAEGDTCSHQDFTPAEFAEALQRESGDAWPEITKTGWKILCHILRLAKEIHDGFPLDFDNQRESEDVTGRHSDEGEDSRTDPGFSLSCSHHEEFRPERVFGKDRTLGHLWAAAQTELLTHRRQCEEHPWTSEKFDLPAVLKCLEKRSILSIPLVKESMMRPYCACGHFELPFSISSPNRTTASSHDFSNMVRFLRETFINEDLLWI
jgi:hypothetical protein